MKCPQYLGAEQHGSAKKIWVGQTPDVFSYLGGWKSSFRINSWVLLVLGTTWLQIRHQCDGWQELTPADSVNQKKYSQRPQTVSFSKAGGAGILANVSDLLLRASQVLDVCIHIQTLKLMIEGFLSGRLFRTTMDFKLDRHQGQAMGDNTRTRRARPLRIETSCFRSAVVGVGVVSFSSRSSRSSEKDPIWTPRGRCHGTCRTWPTHLAQLHVETVPRKASKTHKDCTHGALTHRIEGAHGGLV